MKIVKHEDYHKLSYDNNFIYLKTTSHLYTFYIKDIVGCHSELNYCYVILNNNTIKIIADHGNAARSLVKDIMTISLQKKEKNN